jgi:hypothetical protein
MNKLQGLAPSSDGQRRWCGPTALAAITGKPYAECVSEIERVRGKPFKDISTLEELALVLQAHGYVPQMFVTSLVRHKPTFAQFMARRNPLLRDQFILARVTNHFVAIKDDEVCDAAYTQGACVPFSTLTKGQKWKRVTHFLVVGKE